MEIEFTPAQPGEYLLAFIRENSQDSDLLPPIEERLDPGARWYSANLEGRMVGAASISSSKNLARVSEICVDREKRMQGIGRSMINEIIKRAKSAGASRIMITGVDLRSEASRGFAEAMGFRLERDGVRMEWNPRLLPDLQLPEGYELRTYRDGDEVPWSSLITRAYSTTPNKAEYTPEKVREKWIETPSFMPDGCFFVTHDDRIIGCFMAWREVDAGPKRGRLHWLAVDPEHRRRGIAKFLTVTVIRHLLEKGLNSIFLDTGYNLPVAMEMYMKLGFVVTPRLYDYVMDLD